MSKTYYLKNKSLRGFHKFVPEAKVIQVGNGASVSISFIISIIVPSQGHISEIFSMVSEIHNIDVILGVKNEIKLEAELSMRN